MHIGPHTGRSASREISPSLRRMAHSGQGTRRSMNSDTLQNQKYAGIRGFNYQPSWGSNGLEIWRRFDGALMDVELARGKRYFPGIHAIRLWLSWDACL